jgi:hypothetical protein
MGLADDMARVGEPQARQMTVGSSVSTAIERRCGAPIHPDRLERAALVVVRSGPCYELTGRKGPALSRFGRLVGKGLR